LLFTKLCIVGYVSIINQNTHIIQIHLWKGKEFNGKIAISLIVLELRTSTASGLITNVCLINVIITVFPFPGRVGGRGVASLSEEPNYKALLRLVGYSKAPIKVGSSICRVTFHRRLFWPVLFLKLPVSMLVTWCDKQFWFVVFQNLFEKK
jgi:hypothetical protein